MGYTLKEWQRANKHCTSCGVLISPIATKCKKCHLQFLWDMQRQPPKTQAEKRQYGREKDRGYRKYCPICNTLMDRHSKLCKPCQAKASRGSNSPNWRGGKIPYNGEWKDAREIARKKAKGHCQICGKSEAENGRKLDTHHIKEIRRFLIPEASHISKNLICLCRKCHARIHHPKGSPFSSDLAPVS